VIAWHSSSLHTLALPNGKTTKLGWPRVEKINLFKGEYKEKTWLNTLEILIYHKDLKSFQCGFESHRPHHNFNDLAVFKSERIATRIATLVHCVFCSAIYLLG